MKMDRIIHYSSFDPLIFSLLLHEIIENAYGQVMQTGYEPAHNFAIGVEEQISQELVGSGTRVAEASYNDTTTQPLTTRSVFDYDQYYFCYSHQNDQIVGSSRRAKAEIGRFIIKFGKHKASTNNTNAITQAAQLVNQTDGATGKILICSGANDLGSRRQRTFARREWYRGVTTIRGARSYVKFSEAQTREQIVISVTRPGEAL